MDLKNISVQLHISPQTSIHHFTMEQLTEKEKELEMPQISNDQNDDVQTHAPTFDNDEKSALASARLAKLRKQMNADAWSDELEDLMQSWGEKAAGNRELHSKAAGYWRKFSDRLYLPVILLSTIGGVSNFGAANAENPEYWMYAIGGVNILAATLASIVQYYKPDEKTQAHSSTAKTFGSFYRNMTVELGLSREDRMNSEELTRWAKSEYDRIQNDAPSVPGPIVAQYQKSHQDNRNQPDVVNTKFEIKINRT